MIDVTKETLIGFTQAAKRLPRRPNGKTIHISAIYRWSSRGCKAPDTPGGRIILESIRIGGSSYTSLEALQRFADALTGSRTTLPTTTSRLTRTRQAQAKRAAEQVRQRLGIKQDSAVAVRPEPQSTNAGQRLTGRSNNGF